MEFIKSVTNKIFGTFENKPKIEESDDFDRRKQ